MPAATSGLAVAQVLEKLRQRALDLPFAEVSELVQREGDAADFEKCEKDDPWGWMLIQARGIVHQGGRLYRVKPLSVIGFRTWPGDGCEEANFGLCRYPATLDVTERFGPRRTLKTGLDGWRWQSFCKTQYAAEVSTEHFLKCHLLVVTLLDKAKELGILREVNDEGEYWEKRDAEALAREVGEWNAMVRGFSEQLKAQFGGEAAIDHVPVSQDAPGVDVPKLDLGSLADAVEKLTKAQPWEPDRGEQGRLL